MVVVLKCIEVSRIGLCPQILKWHSLTMGWCRVGGKAKSIFVQIFYFVFPWNAFIVHQWHPATWWLFIHSQYVPIFGEIFKEKTIRKDIQQNILRREKKYSMGNIGILALGDYSFTPLDARSALIATALIATTYLDCSFKKGRILEGDKRNRNLWQSDCWAGSHGKWSKQVVTISRLIGAGQTIIIWFWSWGIRSQNIPTFQHFR